MQYSFGTGTIFGRKTGVATPTPVKFGGLQGVDVDLSFVTKELYGQYQFPIDVARGTAKITGKAKFAQLYAQEFNDLFFGQSAVTAGRVVTVQSEVATVTACIVNVVNNTTFLQDLGVIVNNTGQILTRVSGTPAGSGNYACNESNGGYAFNVAQNNVSVAISYDYTDAGNGSSIVVQNMLLGSAPQFMVVLTETLKGKNLRLQLNACMSSKLTMATKLEDYTIPEFDFVAFADAGNNVGKFSFDE